MATTKYTTDGKYEIKCGKLVVAKSYVGENGYEVRILQGLPRMETVERIFNEVPEFAAANNMDINKVPRLFSK